MCCQSFKKFKVEVRIPANRIFIGRVPDRTSPIELVRFFSQEVAKMDPSAYCVDGEFNSMGKGAKYVFYNFFIQIKKNLNYLYTWDVYFFIFLSQIIISVFLFSLLATALSPIRLLHRGRTIDGPQTGTVSTSQY
jgi:hypothetical protein